MPFFTDQTGNTVAISSASRIISIVPSQTELLYDLGLDKEVVGITKFCVHPKEWFHSKTRVGGTKQLKMEIIQQLKPDLIMANKEENLKEQVEELAQHYPVWTSDIKNLEDALEMIQQIGIITNKQDRAQQLIAEIRENISRLTTPASRLPTSYLIWKDPYMTVGGDTFIHSMLEAAGLANVFSNKKRYPEVNIQDLLNTNCQLLLLSSEPYPFIQKHIDELKAVLSEAEGGIKTQILLVDGEMFSWYGSRLAKAPAYFNELRQKIHQF